MLTNRHARTHSVIRLLTLAGLLGACLPLLAPAQEAQLWGWVIDAQTNQPLVGDVSIIHPAQPHVQFFHARTDASGAYEMKGLP